MKGKRPELRKKERKLNNQRRIERKYKRRRKE
jgi:hypothetical protein